MTIIKNPDWDSSTLTPTYTETLSSPQLPKDTPKLSIAQLKLPCRPSCRFFRVLAIRTSIVQCLACYAAELGSTFIKTDTELREGAYIDG